MRWRDAIRKLEILGKYWFARGNINRHRHLGKPRGLCPFDSFIWPTAPWVCLICHRLRRRLKGMKPMNAVITGGWIRDGEQARAGGFFHEKLIGGPTPVALWWPRNLIDPLKRNVEQYIRTWLSYNGKKLVKKWGLPLGTEFEINIYATKEYSPYIRIHVKDPETPRFLAVTLYIP